MSIGKRNLSQAFMIAMIAMFSAGMGFLVGAASIGCRQKPVPIFYTMFDYVYHSTIDDKLAIQIRPDGTSDIGPVYDRTTEARKLFELVQAWRDDGRIPDCHETSYRSSYWSIQEK